MRLGESWLVVSLSIVAICSVAVMALIISGAATGTLTVSEADRSPESEFAAVRDRFHGAALLTEPTRPPSEYDTAVLSGSRSSGWPILKSLNVISWDPVKHRIYRASLPGHIVMWKGGSLGVPGVYLKLRAQDFRRLPPGVLIDHHGARGERTLVWIE